ncbi:MAG: proton-conducting transporter membrane subunit [bacterium]|nr:proton-conducting transporter membrane subunit [bacterium]
MTLAIWTILIPLATSLLCTTSQAWPRIQQVISFVGAFCLLFCAIALLNQVTVEGTVSTIAGNWPLPFGIEISADPLGSGLVFVAALMLTIAVLWQKSDADRAAPSTMLQPLMHGLVAGCSGAFLTADLFNLYVWFEVALVCSIGLLAQGGTLRHLDAAFKYFALNLVGTLVLLSAVALLYAATGHLNFTALGEAATRTDPAILLPLIGILLLAFLIKAAAFPFFAWLPVSYHTLPAPVLALFSALLSKIGICALLRTVNGIFYPIPTPLLGMLSVIALLSMVTGVLGASYHWDMRRILAFHSISQAGYMVLAIALASQAGTAAAIFFALHHSLVKAGLFLCAALIFREAGHYDLRRIGGMYAAKPGLAVSFMLLALSLVGVPPFSGFWGKYLIVKESIAQGEYLWAGVALAVGALTLYSMLKIWLEAFWKPHPDKNWCRPAAQVSPTAYAGLGALILLTLWMGLFPEALMVFVSDASLRLQGGLP